MKKEAKWFDILNFDFDFDLFSRLYQKFLFHTILYATIDSAFF